VGDPLGKAEPPGRPPPPDNVEPERVRPPSICPSRAIKPPNCALAVPAASGRPAASIASMNGPLRWTASFRAAPLICPVAGSADSCRSRTRLASTSSLAAGVEAAPEPPPPSMDVAVPPAARAPVEAPLPPPVTPKEGLALIRPLPLDDVGMPTPAGAPALLPTPVPVPLPEDAGRLPTICTRRPAPTLSSRLIKVPAPACLGAEVATPSRIACVWVVLAASPDMRGAALFAAVV
jgi:hypothetical protein